MKKPWGVDREFLGLLRPMTRAELADWKAGYPVSRYRRRLAVWGQGAPGDRQAEAEDVVSKRRAA